MQSRYQCINSACALCLLPQFSLQCSKVKHVQWHRKTQPNHSYNTSKAQTTCRVQDASDLYLLHGLPEAHGSSRPDTSEHPLPKFIISQLYLTRYIHNLVHKQQPPAEDVQSSSAIIPTPFMLVIRQTHVSSRDFPDGQPTTTFPFCMGRVSLQNQKGCVLKLQQCKFLLCNNSSSFYSHCCNYRALRLLILSLHPRCPAQPGTLLSGIQSGNSTRSVKERAPNHYNYAQHTMKTKKHSIRKPRTQNSENKEQNKNIFAQIVTGNYSITK